MAVDSWVTDLTTDQRLERQPVLRWQAARPAGTRSWSTPPAATRR